MLNSNEMYLTIGFISGILVTVACHMTMIVWCAINRELKKQDQESVIDPKQNTVKWDWKDDRPIISCSLNEAEEVKRVLDEENLVSSVRCIIEINMRQADLCQRDVVKAAHTLVRDKFNAFGTNNQRHQKHHNLKNMNYIGD